MDAQEQAALDTVTGLMGAMGSGDTVAVFGRMAAHMAQSGKDTGDFTFALRAKVRDGQVVLWNWFEDSFAISRAYHG